MAYLNKPFPRRIARGATGGHGHWMTEIVESVGGHEYATQLWSRARGRWNVSHGIKTSAQHEEAQAHYYMARGRLHTWRFRDWKDYQLSREHSTLVAVTGGWRITRVYGDVAGMEYLRPITRPCPGTVRVYDGSGTLVSTTVDYETGIVGAGGAGYTVECEFDVPCRYDTDRMDTSVLSRKPDGTLFINWANLDIVESREPVPVSTPAPSPSPSPSPGPSPSPEAPSPPAPPPSGASTLAVGYGVRVDDWSPTPFVDIVKQSRGAGAPGEFDENPSIPRDAGGWPTAASQWVITSAADRGCEYATGTFKGRYTDSGSTVMTWPAAGNCSVSNVQRSGNDVTFDVVVTGAPMLILAFSGGISDLRIVHPGYTLDGHPLLRTEALDYYKKAYGLRMLDFMGQNSTQAQGEASWATRQPAGKWHGRKSWEACRDFYLAVANASGSNCRALWVCLPYRWGNDGTSTDFNAVAAWFATWFPVSGHALWVEFSNELWNGIYAQFAVHNAIANNTGHPDYTTINTPAGDQWDRQSRLWALLFARVSAAFKAAFPGGFGTRIKPVLCSQFANIDWMQRQLSWLALSAQVAAFGAIPTHVHAISGACYTGGTEAEMAAAPNATAMLAGLNSSFSYSLTAIPTVMAAWAALKTQYSVPTLVAYEWGVHMHDAANAAVKYDTHLLPTMRAHIVGIGHAMRDAGFTIAFYLGGWVDKYNAVDVNTGWALAQGYQPANSTGKLLGALDLIAEGP